MTTAVYAPPVTTIDGLIAELPAGADVIPLPVIRRIINDRLGPWSEDQQWFAVRSGAISPVAKPRGTQKVGRGTAVDRDQAVLIMVASFLAFAAEVPVVGMIRALRVSGINPALFAQATP